MTRKAWRRMGSSRAIAQARRIGQEIELARGQAGLLHRDLARRAGVATSTVIRVGRGDPGVQVNTLITIGAAVGIDVSLHAYPSDGPRLRDNGQLEVARILAGQADARWRSAMEVPAGDHGRSADLVFYGTDEVVHVEIERYAVDFQAQYRAALRKREHLAESEARPVRLVICFEDRPRNRDALQPHRDLLQQQLPAGSRAVLAALRRGRPLGSDGVLWIRRTRHPGARSR